MSCLKLNYGGVSYLDRTRALESGEVSPAGIDLNYIVPASIGDLFRAVAARTEFEVAEFSLSTLMLMIGKGDNRLVGLPILGISARADLHKRQIGDQAAIRPGRAPGWSFRISNDGCLVGPCASSA